jgi:hypothetical protein
VISREQKEGELFRTGESFREMTIYFHLRGGPAKPQQDGRDSRCLKQGDTQTVAWVVEGWLRKVLIKRAGGGLGL